MGSTPQLPSRVDPELYAYLRHLRDRLSKLESASSGEDDNQEGIDENITGGITPVADTAAVLASNSGPVSTEDAYTTVTPSIAVAGARYAEIRFSVNSTDNADDGDLKCKGAEGIESPILCECVAGASDARDSVIHWVALDANGSFQYKFTNTSTTTIDWSVTYLGYSL